VSLILRQQIGNQLDDLYETLDTVQYDLRVHFALKSHVNSKHFQNIKTYIEDDATDLSAFRRYS
jgi:hypothetical protein